MARRRVRRPTLSLNQVYGRKPARRLKSRISRQASRQARREFRPQVRAARAQLGGAKRALKQEKRSLYGAANILGNALDQQLNQLDSSGLKGRYKQQVAQELQAAKADAARYPAVMLPEARAAYRTEKAETRQTVAGLKADQATTAANTYESLMGKALTEAKAAQKEAATKARAEGETRGERKKEARVAIGVARNLYRIGPEKGKWKSPFNSEKDYELFVRAIAAAEGVDSITMARRAAEALRKALHERAKEQFVGARASGTVGR